MENLKAQIKKWLKETRRTRHWLADQCAETSKRTVDGWLAPSGKIPEGKAKFIERLMMNDTVKSRRVREEVELFDILSDIEVVALKFTKSEWSKIRKAAKMDDMTPEEWIRKKIIEDADEILSE